MAATVRIHSFAYLLNLFFFFSSFFKKVHTHCFHSRGKTGNQPTMMIICTHYHYLLFLSKGAFAPLFTERLRQSDPPSKSAAYSSHLVISVSFFTISRNTNTHFFYIYFSRVIDRDLLLPPHLMNFEGPGRRRVAAPNSVDSRLISRRTNDLSCAPTPTRSLSQTDNTLMISLWVSFIYIFLKIHIYNPFAYKLYRRTCVVYAYANNIASMTIIRS